MRKLYTLAAALMAGVFVSQAASFWVGELQFTTIDDTTVKLSKADPVSGDVVIPATVTNEGVEYTVVEIAANTFRSKTIDSVTIPGTVKTVGASAFQMCRLKKAVIEEGFTTLGYSMFGSCGQLAEVSLPSTLTCLGDEGPFSAGSAFNGCVNLKEITIPAGVTEIPNMTFNGCMALANVTIAGDITSIGEQAFNNCNALASDLSFPKLTSLGSNAFGYCRAMKRIELGGTPENVTGEAFYGCEGLTDVVLGEGIKSIGSRAFNNCYSLTEITLPASMTSVAANAYAGCDKIANVYCYATVPPTGSDNSFVSTVYPTAILHVPEEAIDTYKKADIWKNFATIVSLTDSGVGSIENDTPLTLVDGAVASRLPMKIYDAKGVLLADVAAGTFRLDTLGRGMYIVRSGTHTIKTVVPRRPNANPLFTSRGVAELTAAPPTIFKC